MTVEALEHARTIWNYHQLRHHPIPGDLILALGTNDLRVAGFAADLYHRGFGGTILCTGGFAHQDDLLATAWPKTEAEMYADVLERAGVPGNRILMEMRATNTSENVRFSRELLRNQGISPRNIVVAVKPFMQRRTAATLAVEWPEMPFSITSPEMALEDYFTAELPAERIVNIMVGDLQRIWIYATRGWSAPQRVPREVMQAFQALCTMGYNQHLVANAADL